MIYCWKHILSVTLLCLLVSACTASAGSNIKPLAPSIVQSGLADQSGTIFLPLLQHASTSTTAYLQTFDGAPTQPQPWQPATWDVTVHSRDSDTWTTLEPMRAAHGTDCAPPPASHTITAYEDAVFQCRDHVMTAINAKGYGVIYLTPSQMVDFGDKEAVIGWDMPTLRASQRDWVDLWITPYSQRCSEKAESRTTLHINAGDTLAFITILLSLFA